MVAAEVEHLLGFSQAADGRAGKAAAAHDETEDGYGQRLFRRADHSEIAVAAKHVEIGVDVVIGGHGVEDEVEAARVLGHLVGVGGEDNLIGAEAQGIVFLFGRGGKGDRVGSKSVRELDAHVAESAKADHADLFALGHAPVAHG